MKPGDKVLVEGEVFTDPSGAPVILVVFRGAAGVPTAPIPVMRESVVEDPLVGPPA